MKNKRLTYILLPAALIVWGIIFFRVFKFTQPEEEESNLPFVLSPKKALITKEDSLTLQLNYKDPFLKNTLSYSSDVETELPKENTASVSVEKPKANSVFWPSIKYFGLVKKKGADKEIGLISINGQSHIVSKGQALEGLLVKEFYRDSILLVLGKDSRFITKEK